MLQVVSILREVGASHGQTTESRDQSTFELTVISQVPFDNWTIDFLGLVEFKGVDYELGVSGVRLILWIPNGCTGLGLGSFGCRPVSVLAALSFYIGISS